MKKIIILLVYTAVPFLVRAQLIFPQVMNTTGHSAVAGNLMLEWSVGEMTAVQTFSAGNTILSQGLLQPSGNLAPLPVTLLYFKGNTINKKNLLQWATSQETNSHHFDIERSASGQSFQAWKTVAAAGNAATTTLYSTADSLPYPISYYRLKQVDLDGSFRYSAIIRLQLKTSWEFQLYPNPATTTIQLSGNDEHTGLQLAVFDATGKLVIQKTIAAQATASLNLEALPKATYIINVVESKTGNVWSARFVKL